MNAMVRGRVEAPYGADRPHAPAAHHRRRPPRPTSIDIAYTISALAWLHPEPSLPSLLFMVTRSPAFARSRLQLIASHLKRSPSAAIAPSSSASLQAGSYRMSSSQGGAGGSGSGEGSQQPLAKEVPKFPKSSVAQYGQPLGSGRYVNTAGCLIIGDEVLNGKTRDSNSNFLAKWCFDLGIDLKRIEVIADDEEEIAEAVLRMSKNYDFVVTSGGIGPTPDDISYESIGKAFGAHPLEYDPETLHRMEEHSKTRSYSHKQTEEMLTARKRMALFPSGNKGVKVEVIFPAEDLWVPVVRVASKVHILPGVPRLFEALLTGLEPYTPIDPSKPKPHRILIHTKMPESSISPFLIKLTDKCKPLNIKVGSYPKLFNGVDVSVIGFEPEKLQEIAKEVEQEVNGTITESGQIGGGGAAQKADD
ncbi:unnamed protein product [Parajaminaea phylloscopi]